MYLNMEPAFFVTHMLIHSFKRQEGQYFYFRRYNALAYIRDYILKTKPTVLYLILCDFSQGRNYMQRILLHSIILVFHELTAVSF